MCIIEYYSAIKRNEILPCATVQMHLEGIILSQTEKDKLCMISLICGIWAKPMNRHRVKNTENKKVVTRAEGTCEGREKQVREIKRCKLLVAK